MALYRLEITLKSPLGTPLVGPTLFGLVCQAISDQEGDAAVEDRLGEPERLWRISDGFPVGYLPKPMTKPRPLTPEQLDTLKIRKSKPWIRRDTWMKHRASWSEYEVCAGDYMGNPSCDTRRVHNVVHRHGHGTLETGGLYFVEDDWRFAGRFSGMDLYVDSDEDRPERIRDLIQAVGERGYGRDISTGRGRFEVAGIRPDPELAELVGAHRCMSLSRGVLTSTTMQDAFWRIEPHLGRVGPELTLAGVSPFKRPVLLTQPGCTYQPVGSVPAGRWLNDIHPERPEIGLNGFHLAIPFSEAVQ